MRSFTIFALLVALNAGASIMPQKASAQQLSVNFQLFYDQLSPYGMWVEYPNYGYVWIPTVDPGFTPYATAGHWIFTDDGWTWVSDYPWGWAAFHYGRWDYDDVYGWFWVPDDEWGPAWVSWRRSPGYYGWAPLRPGISMSMAFGSDYHERNERWIFVNDRDITRPDVSRYYVNRTRNVTIINNSTVIVNTRRDDRRNVTYIAGPDRNDVQNVTHTSVNSVVIRDNDQPGHRLSNGELQIYRPQVQKSSGTGQTPAPSKVVKLNDVRPASERNAGNPQRGANPAQNVRTNQPPQNVAPSRNAAVVQPTQPKINQPSERNAGNPQRTVNRTQNARRNQQPATQDVKASNSGGKANQPPNVTPSRKTAVVQPAQPKINQPSVRNTGNPQQNVNAAQNGRKNQQAQIVTPSKKDDKFKPVEPKTNEPKQDKKKQEGKE